METSVHMYSRMTLWFRKDVVPHQVNKNADVMITEIVQSISWHYGEFQQSMLNPEYSPINFIEGLPDMTLDPTKVNLLIIDVLMHELNEVVAKLYTKGSHHRNTSILLSTQTIFHQNKHTITISLNAHYIVLFKNVRYASQITNLAKEI